LRVNPLLLLQLATLAVLVFALARPFMLAPASLSNRILVMLDASASMQAQDEPLSRFEAARARIRDLIRSKPASSEVALILVDSAPRALSAPTADAAALLQALEEATPSLSAANWSAAVALAIAFGAGNPEVETVVFTDGAHADDLGALPGRARAVILGSQSENLALSLLALRLGESRLSALVRLTNTGTRAQRALVAVRADDRLVDARRLSVPPQRDQDWALGELPSEAQVVTAEIREADADYFALDNALYAVNTATVERKVALLSPGNLFLEQALSLLPGIRVARVLTLTAQAEPPADLYVVDGLTASLPSGAHVLWIGGSLPFTVTGNFTDTVYARTTPHPVARAVDWRMVNVQAAQQIERPAWLRPIIQARGGALVLAGEDPSKRWGRVVLLTFDLRRSDLPLQVAFPILVANAVDWLAPPLGFDIPAVIAPGEGVRLPAGAQLVFPNGEATLVPESGVVQTAQLGVYRFTSGERRGAFAVNFVNLKESQLRPNPSLSVGKDPVSATDRQLTEQRELWRLLAIAALALLVVEWWVYQRGLPDLRRKLGRKRA
ncbi:MAG: VWA domain-containing protein, partial [Thermoflexales bacterium]|nr:VWA domain-containing protein [Thermoflexales bacterium]